MKTSIYVAIPSVWIHANDVRKHQELLFELQQDGSLRVTTIEPARRVA